MPCALAKSGTNVKGVISQNTTWTVANSPYNITGNVTVVNGVTLTIQPGVTVISKKNYDDGKGGIFQASLTVEGTLIAIGGSNEPVTFNETQITFSPSSGEWNPQTDSGSIIKKCFFADTEVNIEASPKVDNNVFSGESSTIVIKGGSAVISNNFMTNNSMQIVYGWAGNTDIEIKDANNATIVGNTIDDGMYGISVDYPIAGFSFDSFSGTTTIENNLITNNKGSGINCGASFPLIIVNNTITQNYVGLDFGAFSNKSVIANNNIYNNTGIFDNVDRSVTLESSSGQLTKVNAAYNYWGTTDVAAINKSIHDSKNVPSLGTVTFNPILTSPNESAGPNDNVSKTKFQEELLITGAVSATAAVVLALVALFVYRRKIQTNNK
jgi:Right handed beta helix region